MTGFFPKLPNKGKDYGGLLLEYHPVINKGFVRSWGIQTVVSGWKETLEGSASLGNQSTAWVEFMDQSRVSFITSFLFDCRGVVCHSVLFSNLLRRENHGIDHFADPEAHFQCFFYL